MPPLAVRQDPEKQNSRFPVNLVNGVPHARARMRNCRRSTLLALSPPPGTLSRTCVDGSGFLRNSRGRPRVRARGQSSVFPNFADLRGTHVRQYLYGQIPGTCTGERMRKETRPRFTPQWEPRHARVRAAIPREATLVAPGPPQLIASCSFRTRFQRGSIWITVNALRCFGQHEANTFSKFPLYDVGFPSQGRPIRRRAV